MVGMKKPDLEIFELVIQENGLDPAETLFIDDTKVNTNTAQELGIHTWNLIPRKEDVKELFDKKAAIF